MNSENLKFLKKIRLLNNKKVIIYGIGNFTETLIRILSSFSVKISYCISDSYESASLHGLPVRPSMVEDENENFFIIALNSTVCKKTKSNLLTKNVINGDQLLANYYGFSFGRHTFGYEQFFYKMINIEKIGAFCSIAKTVNIAKGNHPTNYISTHPFFYLHNFGHFVERDRNGLLTDINNKKVIIGNDVWIGTNVTILPSVTVGDGAVIGAGSVVTKDVPSYSIVAGVPAKVIRYRFSEEHIEQLLNIQWWNWTDDVIKERISFFSENTNFLRNFS